MSESFPPCKDFEICQNQSDPKWTMDYTDVEPGAFIYWCFSCGPMWHKVEEALLGKLSSEPGFAKEFEEAINNAQKINH